MKGHGHSRGDTQGSYMAVLAGTLSCLAVWSTCSAESVVSQSGVERRPLQQDRGSHHQRVVVRWVANRSQLINRALLCTDSLSERSLSCPSVSNHQCNPVWTSPRLRAGHTTRSCTASGTAQRATGCGTAPGPVRLAEGPQAWLEAALQYHRGTFAAKSSPRLQCPLLRTRDRRCRPDSFR
jgi:hypothetical protein